MSIKIVLYLFTIFAIHFEGVNSRTCRYLFGSSRPSISVDTEDANVDERYTCGRTNVAHKLMCEETDIPCDYSCKTDDQDQTKLQCEPICELPIVNSTGCKGKTQFNHYCEVSCPDGYSFTAAGKPSSLTLTCDSLDVRNNTQFPQFDRQIDLSDFNCFLNPATEEELNEFIREMKMKFAKGFTIPTTPYFSETIHVSCDQKEEEKILTLKHVGYKEFTLLDQDGNAIEPEICMFCVLENTQNMKDPPTEVKESHSVTVECKEGYSIEGYTSITFACEDAQPECKPHCQARVAASKISYYYPSETFTKKCPEKQAMELGGLLKAKTEFECQENVGNLPAAWNGLEPDKVPCVTVCAVAQADLGDLAKIPKSSPMLFKVGQSLTYSCKDEELKSKCKSDGTFDVTKLCGNATQPPPTVTKSSGGSSSSMIYVYVFAGVGSLGVLVIAGVSVYIYWSRRKKRAEQDESQRYMSQE